MGGALVLTRDKSGNGADGHCPTPVKGIRFQAANGKLLPVPCNRSTCPSCSRRAGMITAAMVGIDAAAEQPEVVSTWTTRDVTTAKTIREASAQVVRRVRAEFGYAARYCSFIEWTTGKAAASGGRRRPHLHTLWKDVPGNEAWRIEVHAREVFGRLAGATVHDAEELRTPAGAAQYVAAHHLKESQAPPPGWGSVRRMRPSRGYWSQPAAQLREQATAFVRDRRLERLSEVLAERAGYPEAAETLWEGLDRRPCEVVRVRERFGRAMAVEA